MYEKFKHFFKTLSTKNSKWVLFIKLISVLKKYMSPKLYFLGKLKMFHQKLNLH